MVVGRLLGSGISKAFHTASKLHSRAPLHSSIWMAIDPKHVTHSSRPTHTTETSMRTITSIGAGAFGLLWVLGVSQVAAFRPVAVPRARTGGKITTASSCVALPVSLPCRPLYSTVA